MCSSTILHTSTTGAPQKLLAGLQQYILDPHPGDINRPCDQVLALDGVLSLCCIQRGIVGSEFKCRLPLLWTKLYRDIVSFIEEYLIVLGQINLYIFEYP
uniref:Predicted protein n=1 Tax=Hordeum vulgare subsp. vulgare TaxID=112509 RepID=F2DS22_HORVV|nr:predicted protein [Hordeum vulgare subsp. vulgare]